MEFEKLQGMIAQILDCKPESVVMTASLVEDLGADSLEVFRILMSMEDTFDLVLSDTLIDQVKTVGDLYAVLSPSS